MGRSRRVSAEILASTGWMSPRSSFRPPFITLRERSGQDPVLFPVPPLSNRVAIFPKTRFARFKIWLIRYKLSVTAPHDWEGEIEGSGSMTRIRSAASHFHMYT
jgi:hypothetical protein